jgi:DnaJ-domain-containing protein 1
MHVANEELLNTVHQLWEQEKQHVVEELDALKKELGHEQRFACMWSKRSGVVRKTKRQVSIEEEMAQLKISLEKLEAKMTHSSWLPLEVKAALEALGISDEATLKEAYRKLAKRHHPDAGGDTSKMAEINKAYETASEWFRSAKYAEC